MEFQAVVMAAGRGSRMTDLTTRAPKPLLPIGNRPMIWYPFNMLDQAGFTEVIVITLKSTVPELHTVIEKFDGIKFDVVTLPDDHDKGTVDSLRFIKHKIRADLLVVSCDLVTYFPLHLLADVHRTNDATLTMLVVPAPNVSDTAVPCPRANRHLERDLIGLDKSHRQVLYCASEADLDEFISFKMADLHRHPYMEIHSRVLDAHLYLMRREVLDLPQLNSTEITMLKGDLVPALVRLQFDSPETGSATIEVTGSQGHDDSHRDVSSTKRQASDTALISSMSTWADPTLTDRGRSGARGGTRGVRCCAYVLEDASVCLRANTLVTYCLANRLMATNQLTALAQAPPPPQNPLHSRSAHVDGESVVGEGSSLADKVSVKASVLGGHCEVSAGVKIVNSVVMDHVHIAPGVTLSGCIVCERATIEEKAELKDCIVCSTQIVPGGKKYSSEVIMLERDQMMEI